MSVGTMAKPKSEPEPRPEPRRPTALTIKGSLEWRAWVERGAEHCRTDVAKVVDAALVAYFRSMGFQEAAPKR